MHNSNTINTAQQISAPLGRVLLATMFFMAGLSKITGYAGTQGYMEAMGVPGMLLPLVIALEVIGGLAIMLGFKTRLVAFALAVLALSQQCYFMLIFQTKCK